MASESPKKKIGRPGLGLSEEEMIDRRKQLNVEYRKNNRDRLNAHDRIRRGCPPELYEQRLREYEERWPQKEIKRIDPLEKRAKKREYMLQYNAEHVEQNRARKQRWAKEHKEEFAAKRAIRARERRLRKYSLTLEQFDGMFAAQGGRCTICLRRRKLVVDHDHKTGKVRALLCDPCNTVLGFIEDNPARLRSAARYLEKHGVRPMPGETLPLFLRAEAQ
jgi:hypothetical protein